MIEATEFAMGCVWLAVLAFTFAVTVTWTPRVPGRHRRNAR